MKKDEKFIKKWEKVRKKGKINYTLTWGLIMGTSTCIGSIMGIIIKIWITSKTFSLNNREMLLFWDSLSYLVYFIGGFLGGLIGTFYIKWDRNENEYYKIINEQSSNK